MPFCLHVVRVVPCERRSGIRGKDFTRHARPRSPRYIPAPPESFALVAAFGPVPPAGSRKFPMPRALTRRTPENSQPSASCPQPCPEISRSSARFPQRSPEFLRPFRKFPSRSAIDPKRSPGFPVRRGDCQAIPPLSQSVPPESRRDQRHSQALPHEQFAPARFFPAG